MTEELTASELIFCAEEREATALRCLGLAVLAPTERSRAASLRDAAMHERQARMLRARAARLRPDHTPPATPPQETPC